MNNSKLNDLYTAIDDVEKLKWTAWDINWFEKSENYWQKLKWLQKSMKSYVDDLLDI